MDGIKAGSPRDVRFSGTMGGLYTTVVLSCVVCVGFGLTSVRDDVNWFKNGERIKNRFVTGVVNGIVDVHCNETTGGAAVEGECLSKVECTKSGGKVGGLCSLLGSCCVVEKTCLQSTSSKLSYFVSPKDFQTDCPLTVNVYSKDVCQMRLDFEKFDIEQPTSRPISPEGDSEGHSAYQCHDDYFKVEEVHKNLGFPHLCGKNGGQHIYVPVAEGQQRVVLRFRLRERNGTNGGGLGPAVWRIKIRQLECRKSGYEHLLNAPSKLMAMYNNLKNKKHPKSDWELIAPPHCLQYYPKSSGTFESFNYNGGQGHYIGNLNYAICLRKTAEVCGARYTADGVFQLNYNKLDENEEQADDRCHPKKPASPEVSQDYIRIPGGVNSGNVNKDFYCDAQLNDGNTIVAKSFEPLYVGVHTDGYKVLKNVPPEEAEDFEEIGFRIRYELLTGQCDTPF